MPNSKNRWVSKDKEGQWKVKQEGKKQSSGSFDTQKAAAESAREAAKKDGGEVIIKGRNGKIRERNSYGNDPCPPKG